MDAKASPGRRLLARLSTADLSYGALENGRPRTNLGSVQASKVAEAASAAFANLATELRAVDATDTLPVGAELPVILCYLCAVDIHGRKPIAAVQEAAFQAYVMRRHTTYAWLGVKRGVPAFFAPVVFPITLALVTVYAPGDGLTVQAAAVLSAILSVLEIIFGQLAGWIITGTQPNESSEAANKAQDVLIDLADDYQTYAYYMLDLACSEDRAMRKLAQIVSCTLSVDRLEASMLALVPRPDPNELDDPLLSAARFRRILQPLRQVVAYVQSEGSIPPQDEGLRGRIEVVHLRDQLQSVLQRLDIVARTPSSANLLGAPQ